MINFLDNWPMWASLAVTIIATAFYLRDRLSMEITSIGIIIALIGLFSIPGATDFFGEPVLPREILAGFSNPALIAIMALLVVGQGIFQTGAIEGPTQYLKRSFEQRPTSTLALTFATAFAISAFMNNTPVVVIFLPILVAMAANREIATSKLMMPLSFVTVFAGMTTLIGSSTNLLAAGSFERLTGQTLGFFAQTPIGLILSAAGFIYILLASRFLLPLHVGSIESEELISRRHFLIRLTIHKNHFLFEKSPTAGFFKDLPDMSVRAIQRGKETLFPPYDEVVLSAGDVLTVATTRKALAKLIDERREILKDIWKQTVGGYRFTEEIPEELTFVEAMIAPGSRLGGRTVEMASRDNPGNLVTVGIQRRYRMATNFFKDVRLIPSDILLFCGTADAIRELRGNRDVVIMQGSQKEISSPDSKRIKTARLIAITMIGAIALGLVDIVLATVAAATAMVVTKCLNTRQAIRALDMRIFLVIAAALAMSAALERTGAAAMLAESVVSFFAQYGQLALLSALFLTVALLTNIISNAAAAVLFTPVAIAAAQQSGASDPLPFILAVIFGANCCFATPIAYQTNMLVMGPGRYKFSDFLKFGGPLVLLMWLVFTIVAYWFFDLG